MSSVFYNLGRSVGYATIPALRKSRWVWQTLTGSEAEALRAESEFGRAMAGELRLKTGVSNNAEDQHLVREIGQRLARCIRNKSRSFRVEVLRDPEPTAFALPGGFIFLSAPLLELSQRQPAELAFVIGHEMGHIVRGHAVERLSQRIGTEGLSAILSRGLLNPLVRESGLKWLQSAQSRDAEAEADEFGVRISAAAGYNTYGAVRLLKRLSALRRQPHTLGEYFRSHPSEEERIRAVSQIIRELSSSNPAPRPTPKE